MAMTGGSEYFWQVAIFFFVSEHVSEMRAVILSLNISLLSKETQQIVKGTPEIERAPHGQQGEYIPAVLF